MKDIETQPESTDLVARLRAPEQWRSFPDRDDDAPREAASEIEKLRAENSALKRDLVCCDEAQINMVKRIQEVISGQ